MARLHLLAALALAAPYATVSALHNRHVDVHVISSVLVARDHDAAVATTTTAPRACSQLMGLYTECDGDMPSFTTPPNADFTNCFCDFHNGLPSYYSKMDALISSCSPWAATAAPSVYDFTSDFMTICDHTIAVPPSGPDWSSSWADDNNDDDTSTSTVHHTIIVSSTSTSTSISTATSTPSTDSTNSSSTTDGTTTPTNISSNTSSTNSRSTTASTTTTTQTQTALAVPATGRPGGISLWVANAFAVLAAAALA
ncbi:hypothetical protein B0T19DRAFT_233366 [Cercophora scortea]|uniref:Uncharacterized protein n=1 Tax=Cercophora scortea TaxID=314031 RepID=A0AAE0M9R5_9PEZI|nr:hypothetical protein B0T19DRAFT_233366 [Cercophora scortea]